MALDPVHLAILYEYANWSKKTSGSKKLRKLLSKAKANAVGKQYSPDSWGTPYTGELSKPLTPSEDDIRQGIRDVSMPEVEAKAFFEGLDCTSPFAERVGFIRGISALCVLHPYEVKKKVTGANKEVSKVLWSACADRLEWLLSYVRLRHCIPREYLPFLPSGTTSNEALPAEIHSWNKSTNSMHRSTLALKLRYFSYIKLFAHHLAICHPLMRLVSQSVLLARATGLSIWTEDVWKAWCGQQHDGSKQRKAVLPLSKARDSEEALIKQHVLKRPAASSVKHVKKQRTTPLSVPRRRSLGSPRTKRVTK